VVDVAGDDHDHDAEEEGDVTRRLSLLATFLLFLLVVIVAQAFNVQWIKAPALDASGLNPRLTTASANAPRGEIVAADGTVLAKSVPTHNAAEPYQRVYPLGSLTAGVVGFASPSYGDYWLESQYNSLLTPHDQPAQSVAQLLAPTSAADTVNITLYPALQAIARTAMAGQDGAAVVLDPRTGAVLAMYSNPSYNPAPMTSFSTAVAAREWKKITTPDAHGFEPLNQLAIQATFPPGSTFKVITTAAAVINKPALLTKAYKWAAYTKLPDTNKLLYNDGGTACGGTAAQMLPASCDPGYALLGLDIGAADMSATANAFGYNQTIPFDLPGVASSYFPSAGTFTYNLPALAYSSIGQENVRATALQQALVAEAVADGGVEMTPHLLDNVTGPDGTVLSTYGDNVWKTPLTSAQAAKIVPLMENVVRFGTAAYVGFPSCEDVAAKTGTAQTGNGEHNTDDWMIAFAPATDPTVAIAVVMPFQSVNGLGATVAGPVVKALIEGTLALQAHEPVSATSDICPKA
jgi:peptidoglycan glycosyltransferase